MSKVNQEKINEAIELLKEAGVDLHIHDAVLCKISRDVEVIDRIERDILLVARK